MPELNLEQLEESVINFNQRNGGILSQSKL
jgi:hypothetical protein